ncbi:TRPL translocation defect protein 14-like [Acanthaster planci]|uniref:TRPL translocation defect protein 14-like n=1 Tax=Acanthaster planci TaxID=133434 RepID=A0A8B7Z681_ACAPL|nr:TRPL translocation defect protein 14-like [Acanthaster planci]XP_022101148.1 TRPL translocation defect protein 14-like [Acanthaster planci]
MEKERKVYKIVLTGGPCGGKTTGQARLATFFENLGYKVYMVHETATFLLSGGIKCAELSDDEAYKFQANLLKTLLQAEETFFQLAETCPRKCLVICDRGAMDPSAYLAEGEWDKMREEYGFDNVALRDKRYDQVIHMQSAANGAEEFYTGSQGNTTRTESCSYAVKVDNMTKQAWVGHPYFDIIDNSTDFEGKIKRMISTIADRMGLDIGDRLAKNSIKRKFLVAEHLDEKMFPPFEDFEVKHDYLTTSSDGTRARLRKRGQNGIYTYMHTVCRPEITQQAITLRTPVTSRQYNILLAQRDPTRSQIVKTRRCFLWKNQYFHMDMFREPSNDRCKGLILLETYTTMTGNDLPLPDFLKISKEVTDNPDYSMFNLCKI